MADEFSALKIIGEQLEELDDDARGRVLRWALDKFKVTPPGNAEGRSAPSAISREHLEAADLPAYFNAAQPQTGPEKALLVGAWFQHIQGLTDFESGPVNRELKNLGHQSTNITRDFDELMRRRPKLVVQTRKSGSSKQARKLYRVTIEGLAEVAKMRGERVS